MTRGGPAPTMDDARWVLRGLLILAGFGAVVSVAFSAALGLGLFRGDGDGWTTYRNSELGYEIGYPEGWTAVERGLASVWIAPEAHLADPFVDRIAPAVVVLPSPDDDWCMGARIESRLITTSRFRGEERLCYPAAEVCAQLDSCEPMAVARFFVAGGVRYAVVGMMGGETETVERIVDSFRLLNPR